MLTGKGAMLLVLSMTISSLVTAKWLGTMASKKQAAAQADQRQKTDNDATRIQGPCAQVAENGAKAGSSAIKIAAARRSEKQCLGELMKSLNLDVVYNDGLDDWVTTYKFLERISKSLGLKNALARAREDDVRVSLGYQFSIYEGFVIVDIKATDEEIIDFLVGSSPSGPGSSVQSGAQ